jgi:hypothetical protein
MAAACILMISTDLYQCDPQQERASKRFSCAIGPTRALKEEDHGLLPLLQGRSYSSYVLTSTYCLSNKKTPFREFLLLTFPSTTSKRIHSQHFNSVPSSTISITSPTHPEPHARHTKPRRQN